MTRSLIAGLLAAALIVPSQAIAFRSWNQHDVVDVGNGVFEVIARVGNQPLDYWCAAGDYARRVLNARTPDKVYVWRPEGPSTVRATYRAVQFSMSVPPSGVAPPSFSINVKKVGENMAVSFADGYCTDSAFYFLAAPNDR